MHKIPLTHIEENGLRAHGLNIGTPSQLSDVFRQGVAWGFANRQASEREAVPDDLHEPVACPFCGGTAGHWEGCKAPAQERKETYFSLNQYKEPIEEWADYAKRSGLLDADGIATDRSKAQTAWFAFSFAWNKSWEVNRRAEPQKTEPVNGSPFPSSIN